jgi:hypothetical protein
MSGTIHSAIPCHYMQYVIQENFQNLSVSEWRWQTETRSPSSATLHWRTVNICCSGIFWLYSQVTLRMQHHIPEDTNLHIHECENLKSQIPPCSLVQSQQDKTSRCLQDVSTYVFTTLHGVTSQKTVFKLNYKVSYLRWQSSNYIARRHISEDSLHNITRHHIPEDSLQTALRHLRTQFSNHTTRRFKTVFKIYYTVLHFRRQSSKYKASQLWR